MAKVGPETLQPLRPHLCRVWVGLRGKAAGCEWGPWRAPPSPARALIGTLRETQGPQPVAAAFLRALHLFPPGAPHHLICAAPRGVDPTPPSWMGWRGGGEQDALGLLPKQGWAVAVLTDPSATPPWLQKAPSLAPRSQGGGWPFTACGIVWHPPPHAARSAGDCRRARYKRPRIETLENTRTVMRMLEDIGTGHAHIEPNRALAEEMVADGFRNVAIEAFASLGSTGKYPYNVERDLVRWRRR